MENRTKFENGLFSVRFIGEHFNNRGVSIYDFASTLMSIQRIINKAHLSQKNRLKKGVFPNKKERQMLSLQIGERRRQSDAFSLFPLLTDPQILEYLKVLGGYVSSSLVGYYVGDVLNRLKNEKNEQKQQFIGSIQADVVNIVGRIDAAGGVEKIEIGYPSIPDAKSSTFDAKSKEYIVQLSHQYYLGRQQSIKGHVYRLYPNIGLVTIRRSSGRKVNMHLTEEDFNSIRYNKNGDPKINFIGRPRFKMGIETKVVTEVEVDSIEFE